MRRSASRRRRRRPDAGRRQGAVDHHRQQQSIGDAVGERASTLTSDHQDRSRRKNLRRARSQRLPRRQRASHRGRDQVDVQRADLAAGSAALAFGSLDAAGAYDVEQLAIWEDRRICRRGRDGSGAGNMPRRRDRRRPRVCSTTRPRPRAGAIWSRRRRLQRRSAQRNARRRDARSHSIDRPHRRSEGAAAGR